MEDLKSLSKMLVKGMEIRKKYMDVSNQKFPSFVTRWQTKELHNGFVSGSYPIRMAILITLSPERACRSTKRPLLKVSKSLIKQSH